jgi:hypothetical protein
LTTAISGTGLRQAVLAGQPVALRRRVLRSWLLAAGVTGLTADHLVRLDRLVTHPSATAAVRLPGGLDAVVTRDPAEPESVSTARGAAESVSTGQDRALTPVIRLTPAR